MELEGIGATTAMAGVGAADQSYRTKFGAMYVALTESFLDSDAGRDVRGKVQLIFTSPPFPLNRKKKYGNKTGEQCRLIRQRGGTGGSSAASRARCSSARVFSWGKLCAASV